MKALCGGVVYMAVGFVYDPIYLQHDTGDHPENASRLELIMEQLQQAELLHRLDPIAAEAATLADLTRVHHPALVQQVRQLSQRGGGYIDSDTVVGPQSYKAALSAVGGTIAAVRAVLLGQVRSAFALVRPPGHHATRQDAMGFCLFNNIAAAAEWALSEGQISRLAIVDFDVHHGNGTADIVERDPRVLFISLHQYPFYPGTGHWREKGGPESTMLNVSLPPQTGDRGYAQAMDKLVLPSLRRFAPEIILVSAGYDAHWSDPLAWMLLSIEGYRYIVDSLLRVADDLCGGRLAMTLEGGYGPALAHGVAATFAAMLGEPYADPLGLAGEPEVSVDSLVQAIAEYHGLLG